VEQEKELILDKSLGEITANSKRRNRNSHGRQKEGSNTNLGNETGQGSRHNLDINMIN